MTDPRLAGRWTMCFWAGGRSPAHPLPLRPPPPAGAGPRPSGGWRSASPCCRPQPGTGAVGGAGACLPDVCSIWPHYYNQQYSEKAASTNYTPLFKESHFYSHSNYCQTSPTCLLMSHSPAPWLPHPCPGPGAAPLHLLGSARMSPRCPHTSTE